MDISDHYITPRGLNVENEGVIPFRKGARVPMHMHTERAHILVLSGRQRDQHGIIGPGTLRIHAPGTYHSVVSEAGCIVLAVYEKPVKFLENTGTREA